MEVRNGPKLAGLILNATGAAVVVITICLKETWIWESEADIDEVRGIDGRDLLRRATNFPLRGISNTVGNKGKEKIIKYIQAGGLKN